MGELTLTPWRRYGHDRVYIADGATRLGHLDRVTGALTLSDARRAADAAALAAAGLVTPPEPTPAPEPALPPIAWAVTLPGDTATYKPGASARARARAERDAAPVRTALARAFGVHTAERAWRRGAEGEERVARQLATLPPGWVVLHDLHVGDRGANVDHVAIGPGGVFTLNTKNLSRPVTVSGDTFRVNGFRTEYVRAARIEATRVGRLLGRAVGAPVAVHGVIVVLAPSLTVTRLPRDVAVVGGHVVRDWLVRCPPALAPWQVATLERAARDPRTWR